MGQAADDTAPFAPSHGQGGTDHDETADGGTWDPFTPAPIPARLVRPVDEVRYLVADHAVGRYRVIMRYFFEQHERSRFWLTADEILEHVRRVYDPDYTPDECDRDLGQLVQWRNLAAEQERSRARTVEEFIRKRLRFQITRYAVEVERLLARLERQRGSGGSLDPSYLEGLWDRLVRLDRMLATTGREGSAEAGTLDPAQVRTLWREAYEYFTKTRDFANDYLASLSAARPRDINEFDAFITYKDLLVQHLRRFVHGLIAHADQIAALLRRWRQTGVAERVARLAAAVDAQEPDPETGLPPDVEACRDHRLNEFVSLHNWFCGRGGVDVLQRATTDAIEVIVRQTQRLIDHRRGGVGLQRDLEELAAAFRRCRDLDEAHRLAGLAFGALGTQHLQSEEPRQVPVDRDVWREAEPVPVELAPIARGPRARGRSEAVADRRAEREEALRRERLRRQEEAALWDAIFAGGALDLAEVRLERPELRDRLLEVLGRCFQSPDRSAIAPDGSRIELVASVPGALGRLVAPDGTLYLGRYRLIRHASPLARAATGNGRAIALHHGRGGSDHDGRR